MGFSQRGGGGGVKVKVILHFFLVSEGLFEVHFKLFQAGPFIFVCEADLEVLMLSVSQSVVMLKKTFRVTE